MNDQIAQDGEGEASASAPRGAALNAVEARVASTTSGPRGTSAPGRKSEPRGTEATEAASATPQAAAEKSPPPNGIWGRQATSLWNAAALALIRDVRLAFRKRGQLVQPLVFFAIVTTLFPLGISPDLSRLRDVAPGVLWVAALLSSQLALEFLFRDDAQDGTLEQHALSGQPLTGLLFAKTIAHWLLTGLPLAVMAPLAGLSLGVPAAAVPGIVASVAVGSVALSLIGSMGAALTLGVKRSGALLSLLTLPLAMPVLIFGARATELAVKGESYGAPLELLGAVAVLGITLAPLATAAAVRVNLE